MHGRLLPALKPCQDNSIPQRLAPPPRGRGTVQLGSLTFFTRLQHESELPPHPCCPSPQTPRFSFEPQSPPACLPEVDDSIFGRCQPWCQFDCWSLEEFSAVRLVGVAVRCVSSLSLCSNQNLQMGSLFVCCPWHLCNASMSARPDLSSTSNPNGRRPSSARKPRRSKERPPPPPHEAHINDIRHINTNNDDDENINNNT